MIGKRTVKERPVPLAEVLMVLEKEKKAGELEYGQRLTYDYAQKLVKLDPKKAKELMEELLKLERLREHQVVALVDLMPETKEDVELIFAKERTRLEEDEIKKILDIINKYRE
ncbi:MAG: RNA polymerase Rpb4 family protein [Candidatus Hodarchaeaceae archaeon]|nr:RNA polymerase Rpb4 family protein [Candidatus Hodarchaeaceae archaeon]